MDDVPLFPPSPRGASFDVELQPSPRGPKISRLQLALVITGDGLLILLLGWLLVQYLSILGFHGNPWVAFSFGFLESLVILITLHIFMLFFWSRTPAMAILGCHLWSEGGDPPDLLAAWRYVKIALLSFFTLGFYLLRSSTKRFFYHHPIVKHGNDPGSGRL